MQVQEEQHHVATPKVDVEIDLAAADLSRVAGITGVCISKQGQSVQYGDDGKLCRLAVTLAEAAGASAGPVRVHTRGLSIVAVTFPEHKVIVVNAHELGHPIAKSLNRMIRRRMARVFK